MSPFARRIARFACVATFAGCGGGSPRVIASKPASATGLAPIAVASPSATPPPVRDDGRLPETAVPLGYSVDLRIDPNGARFSGITTILVDVPRPLPFIVLNAQGMNVTRAKARVGEADFAVTVSTRRAHDSVDADELVLSFGRPLPPGSARVEITYDAPFAADLAGIYRVTESGRSYAFSQFESTDARRAFPCFDEPGYKTPYDVTITSPRGMVALSNAPEVSHTDLADGSVSHKFTTTPPLPSYLVAFAVGDFDVVEGQKAPVPIRVVTTKGRGALANLALDVAAAMIAKLSEYFDMRYPYAKLDLVAVPDFAAGAMENPGLVTFRDVLLLVDPDRATTALRRSQAEVIAHEFAHQWFGDLVTMKWWDDLWLNEGFATWAAAKMVDAWKPNFGAVIEQIASTEYVMDTDALATSRAIRQKVQSTGEAMEAFDGITYDKGAAVLRMLEAWLGADTFRRGIQRYVRENAWKNAGADDLFKALDYVSAQRAGELASGFLDQAGVPEVFATLRCAAAGGGANQLELRASEWRALGEPARESPRKWTLPVCIATDAQKAKSCFTLGSEPIVRDLGGRCPSWIYPNDGLAGYYRFVLGRQELLALSAAGRSIDAIDRLGLVSNAWAGVRQGTIEPGVLLDVLGAFDGEPNRFVVEQVVGVIRGIDHALVGDETRAAFERYVFARLSGKKRALGWEPATGAAAEDDERKLERRAILFAMGEIAADAATLDEAEKYAKLWLSDPADVSGDTAATAVPLASIHAGAARLMELRAAARAARVPQDRVTALRAMGWFDDPSVLRAALDLTLTDEVKISEMRYVMGEAGGRRSGRRVLFTWEKENWTRLRARLPGALSRGLAGIAGGACSAADVEDARSFFTTAMRGIEGAKRPLDQALEWADQCVALRDQDAAKVGAWLGGHSVARAGP